jgi:hypothetical protein
MGGGGGGGSKLHFYIYRHVSIINATKSVLQKIDM